MQCFKPIFVRGPDQPPVPCGKCFACQSNRRKDFFMRVKYELLHSLYSLTLTLTYDDEHISSPIPYWPTDDPLYKIDHEPDYYYHPIDLDHVQRFFKRLRKAGYKFRYFGVGEYGSRSARPHYHIIVFFNEVFDWRKFKLDVFNQWFYGSQIVIDETNDDCIGYTLKYCLKPYTSTDPNPKLFCSKKPFIGAGYLSSATSDYLYRHDYDGVINTQAGKMRLPRIYRDKLFSSVFDELQRDIQTASLTEFVEKKQTEDKLKAFERGLTYQEFQKQQRDIFVSKVWKQIKKKSI